MAASISKSRGLAEDNAKLRGRPFPFLGLQPSLATKSLQISVKTFFFFLFFWSSIEFGEKLGQKCLQQNGVTNAFGQGCKSVPPYKILRFKYWSDAMTLVGAISTGIKLQLVFINYHYYYHYY